MASERAASSRRRVMVPRKNIFAALDCQQKSLLSPEPDRLPKLGAGKLVAGQP